MSNVENRELETTKDCDGNMIQSGDKVSYINRITEMVTEGIIHHMIGGSFGIESKTHRGIYKYTEVNTFQIRKQQL